MHHEAAYEELLKDVEDAIDEHALTLQQQDVSMISRTHEDLLRALAKLYRELERTNASPQRLALIRMVGSHAKHLRGNPHLHEHAELMQELQSILFPGWHAKKQVVEYADIGHVEEEPKPNDILKAVLKEAKGTIARQAEEFAALVDDRDGKAFVKRMSFINVIQRVINGLPSRNPDARELAYQLRALHKHFKRLPSGIDFDEYGRRAEEAIALVQHWG